MNKFMEVFTVFFPKTPQFYNLVDAEYNQGKGSRVTYALRKEQQEMIDAIAEYTGNTTVETLRRIIDDWKQQTINKEIAVE